MRKNKKLTLDAKKLSKFYIYLEKLSLEDFVQDIMQYRSKRGPFALLRQEYDEAQDSISSHHSIYWKEMVNALSFIVNYPAKYLSGEDFLRLKNTLQPFIAVIIAYAPQQCCEELMALYEAGRPPHHCGSRQRQPRGISQRRYFSYK